ncbi:cytochrome P450 [Pseudoneurospora amorphoporcata]|uniref:Cytochrome P450 n=1 Tax=Pseudoneurospora amorphoporcata TaxID=241081 RepID=A0AAN6NT95_9PEZI|nr:cytochrome P450 [Pseudoneurospora amorphoporcata]
MDTFTKDFTAVIPFRGISLPPLGSLASSVLLFSLTVIAILLVPSIYQGLTCPLGHIPGPWYTRFTDWVLTYKWAVGQRSFYVHELHKKYGPVVRITPDEVDICDVAAKQIIYTTKEKFVKSPWYQGLVGISGDNIFTTQNVDAHRRYRRLLSGPLSETSLKTVEPVIRERADLAMQRIEEDIKAKGFVDVYKWTMFMATDIIGELAFGESFRCLEHGEVTQYIKDLSSIATADAFRTTFPKIVSFIQKHRIPTPIEGINNAVTVGNNLRTYAEQSLQRYHKLVEADPYQVKPMLFTKVIKAGEEDNLTFDEIVDNARSYIIAGSDTTAHSLTYLFWSVCKNRKIHARLTEELRTKLPRDDHEITDEHLHDLPYLNCVIEETLRLWSAAPSGLPRSVPAEGATLSGYHLPRGTTVCTQAYSLHRDEKIFKDPEQFVPERWEEGNVTKQMKDAFFAFGGGARVCVGLHLARMELRLLTALFFRAYPNAKVSTREGMCDADMEPLIWFLLSPKGKRCLIEP